MMKEEHSRCTNVIGRIGEQSDLALMVVVLFIFKKQVVRALVNQRPSVKGRQEGMKIRVLNRLASLLLCIATVVTPLLMAHLSPILAIMLALPPLTQLVLSNEGRVFQPFDGGIRFATLQGIGWSAYATLAVDVILLTSCALPAESQLAVSFSLNEPRTLGLLAAFSHFALLLSFMSPQSILAEWSVTADLLGVISLALSASSLGLSLALDADQFETERLSAFLLGPILNQSDLRRLAQITSFSAAPLFLFGHRPFFLFPLSLLEMLAFFFYLSGAGLALTSTVLTSGASLLLASNILLLASRRAPLDCQKFIILRTWQQVKVPATKQQACDLLALCAIRRGQIPWPAHLTRAVSAFAYEQRSSCRQSQLSEN